MTKLINIKELSQQINVPVSTLYQWSAQNRIPHIKLPNSGVRFDPVAIEKWLKSRSVSVNEYA